jgi:hypothetical protein
MPAFKDLQQTLHHPWEAVAEAVGHADMQQTLACMLIRICPPCRRKRMTCPCVQVWKRYPVPTRFQERLELELVRYASS